MSYDRCDHCDHVWHGLVCEATMYKRGGKAWERVPCGCASAWEPPAVLVEGDALQGVARDA